MHTKSNNNRKATGSSMLDIPVGLMMVMVVLFIPLVSLASVTLRSTIVAAIMRDAAHQAAKSRTFLRPVQGEKSATEAAQDALQTSLASFPGITLTNVDVDIIACGASTQERFEEKLPAPADPTQFVYLLDVTATVQITPLIQGDERLFGSIAGITTPMIVPVGASQISEHTEGLHE